MLTSHTTNLRMATVCLPLHWCPRGRRQQQDTPRWLSLNCLHLQYRKIVVDFSKFMLGTLDEPKSLCFYFLLLAQSSPFSGVVTASAMQSFFLKVFMNALNT